MALDQYQVGYFITQVALAAASFGVAQADIEIVGYALGNLFNVKCGPSTVVIPSQPAGLQSICIESTCAQAMNATCGSYAAVAQPAIANATLADGEGVNATAPVSTVTGTPTATSMASGSGTATASAGATTSSAAAAVMEMGSVMAAAAAAFAFLL